MTEQPDCPEPPMPPHMRTFSMNSREAYEAMCQRTDPMSWGPQVIVEGR